MAELRTDYADAKLDISKNLTRKYNMISNGDGTASFVDTTNYSTKGISFGAKDINEINEILNKTIIFKSFDPNTGILNTISVSATSARRFPLRMGYDNKTIKA